MINWLITRNIPACSCGFPELQINSTGRWSVGAVSQQQHCVKTHSWWYTLVCSVNCENISLKCVQTTCSRWIQSVRVKIYKQINYQRKGGWWAADLETQHLHGRRLSPLKPRLRDATVVRISASFRDGQLERDGRHAATVLIWIHDEIVHDS